VVEIFRGSGSCVSMLVAVVWRVACCVCVAGTIRRRVRGECAFRRWMESTESNASGTVSYMGRGKRGECRLGVVGCLNVDHRWGDYTWKR